jgi:hypothetical protein
MLKVNAQLGDGLATASQSLVLQYKGRIGRKAVIYLPSQKRTSVILNTHIHVLMRIIGLQMLKKR